MSTLVGWSRSASSISIESESIQCAVKGTRERAEVWDKPQRSLCLGWSIGSRCGLEGPAGAGSWQEILANGADPLLSVRTRALNSCRVTPGAQQLHLHRFREASAIGRYPIRLQVLIARYLSRIRSVTIPLIRSCNSKRRSTMSDPR